ncbi:hypothetical protein [Actinoplanes sp. NPDC051494]|uniref:hypothetical protein n=1 Tax=Actinoplanes sp. NPDC051494 TaxID=3363907 RepID=UPI00378D37C5
MPAIWHFYGGPTGTTSFEEELINLPAEAEAEVRFAIKCHKDRHRSPGVSTEPPPLDDQNIDGQLRVIWVTTSENKTYALLYAPLANAGGSASRAVVALHITVARSRKINDSTRRLAHDRLRTWRKHP